MGFNFQYRLQNPIFLGNIFGGTHAKKKQPKMIVWGGVHGKICCLIAYIQVAYILLKTIEELLLVMSIQNFNSLKECVKIK